MSNYHKAAGSRAKARRTAIKPADTVEWKLAANAGDALAQCKLEVYALNLVEPTIGALIREGRLGRGAYADDDLLQEGRTAALAVLARWQPEVAGLVTFMYQRLRHALLTHAYAQIPEAAMVSTSSEANDTDNDDESSATVGDNLTYEDEKAGLEEPGSEDGVRDVLEQMGKLSAAEREAINLHYLQDLNLRDTAKRLGLTHPQQAKRLVDSAVTTLRSLNK